MRRILTGLLLAGLSGGCGDRCADTDHCRNSGLCRSKSRWSASSECLPDPAGCQAAEVCAKFGECTVAAAEPPHCAVKREEDCRASAVCRELGACGLSPDGSCWATTDAMCQASPLCRELGLCSARDGYCVATSEPSCRASERCKSLGACTFVAGAPNPKQCAAEDPKLRCRVSPPYPKVALGPRQVDAQPPRLDCYPRCERQPPQPSAAEDPLNPRCGQIEMQIHLPAGPSL